MEPAVSDRASSEHVDSWIVALPNSTVIAISRTGLVAYTPAGKHAWAFTLPDGDTVAAAPVVAASSTTYVRGTRELYAIAYDGRLLWHTRHEDASAAIKGIVAMNDSTVSITAEDDLLVNYGPDGHRRWIFALPDGDRVSAQPVASPNNFIYIRGARRIYAVSSGGTLAWQADIGE